MLKEEIFKIISQVMNIPIEQINENSSSENIEKWDSLQNMNLILALEERFNIRFTDEDIMQMVNTKVIIEVLEQKRKE